MALLGGDGVARGLDLQLSRRLYDHWDMTVGYTYLLTEIQSSINKDLGNAFRNAPRHRVAAFLTYETPEYEFGGGVQYASTRYASALPDSFGNRFQADAYATLSLMAGYTVSDHMKVQFNIDNVTDEFYISGVDDTRATPGPGRSFIFSARWKY